MTTAQHRSMQITALGSCHELGVCQGRTPRCPGCSYPDATKALEASAQASRDTGCCFVLDDEAFRESLTPVERIAYWGCVGLAVGLTVAAVFGTAGYFSAKALGL